MKTKYIKYLIAVFFVGNLFSQEKFEVFFDFNNYQINDNAQRKLNTWISNNSNVKVERIYGYCDWIGSDSYNDSLSIRRTRSVYEYLQKHQIAIDSSYFEKGFGKRFEQSTIQEENRKVIVYYKIINPEPISFINALSAPSLTTKLLEANVGQIINLDDLIFQNNSAVVRRSSLPILDELVCILQENPTIKVEIRGHICCKINGDSANLSLQRARTVYSYLIRNKIKRDRLSYKGLGTTSPKFLIPEKSLEEEFANRRVEIFIIAK